MEKIYDLKISAARTKELDLSTILDAKKLLHLHPHWFVDECKERDNGIFASLKDYETEDEFQLGLRLDFDSSSVKKVSGSQTVLRITLFDFLVNEILFFTSQDKMQVRIRGEEETIDGEIEQSIYLWIRGIQEYIRLYTSNRPTVLFFRLIMNRMILQMNPSQRKICIMLTKITLVELLVIVVIVVGYFFFVQ